MHNIGKSLQFPELELRPEIKEMIKLSDDMQQTLASIIGYDGVSRRLLRCSENGVLNVSSPRIKDIFHVSNSGANYAWQGDNVKATEVMIMAHPDNNALIWVKNDEAASDENGWPLVKKEIIAITVDNLKNIHLLIVGAGETAIIAYTK